MSDMSFYLIALAVAFGFIIGVTALGVLYIVLAYLLQWMDNTGRLL